jgi:hypothetical protein
MGLCPGMSCRKVYPEVGVYTRKGSIVWLKRKDIKGISYLELIRNVREQVG